jgi:threonine/homoserine/homoserine lactone efflux protein
LLSNLLVGAMFGLSAGFAPGPLLTLVITQTLKHNAREGLRVAIAPVLTDVPIILISFFILIKLSALGPALGFISTAGGFYVLYLAYETIKPGPIKTETSIRQPRSIRKGALVNALNPHPYLFWATVGVPFILKTRHIEAIAPWLFVFSFYLFLIGSKVLIVLIVGRFKAFLEGKIYRYLMRGLGIVLVGFAIFLFWDALVLFGLLPK